MEEQGEQKGREEQRAGGFCDGSRLGRAGRIWGRDEQRACRRRESWGKSREAMGPGRAMGQEEHVGQGAGMKQGTGRIRGVRGKANKGRQGTDPWPTP